MKHKTGGAMRLDDSISSPQDVKALALEVREYARWFAHNYIKLRVHAKNTVPAPAITPAANAAIHTWHAGKEPTTQSLDGLLQALDDYAHSAPQITITLAAAATPGLKKTLVAWCRENLAPNALVTFQFNSTLLGGMVVRTGSRVFDWSFRRIILAERGTFPEVLRRV